MPDERSHSLASPALPCAAAAFRLLCDAGALLAASPDHEATLPELARLVTGSVADLCWVDVVMPDGPTVRVAAVHRDPAMAPRVWEIRRFPADFEDPEDPFGRVGRTGEALRVAEVEGGWLDTNVGDAEHREILRSLGVCSLVAAPLDARGKRLGLITLASTDPSRRFGPEALALAEELGRRIALSVDSARLAREVLEAREAETQFLATMSHEFRTPVYIASMFAELLLMGVPEPVPPSAREHAEHIKAAAKHLEDLVQQILTFSRLDADREAVRRERVDLEGLARETAGLIEPLARQKELVLDTDLPARGVEATTDPNKLRQILFNLLGNAVKFTDSGEVCLGLRAEAGWAVFEVRDTGIGIAPEHQEKIFEPFWQVDRESRAGVKGTGLGLNIVKRLVHLLDGELAVESAPGTGTVFRVLIPLGQDES